MRYLKLSLVSYLLTLLFGTIIWGEASSLVEVAHTDASDMLTFYRFSKTDINNVILLTTGAKTILLTQIIHFAEFFHSVELVAFLTIKWAIYFFCSIYFLRTFDSFVSNSFTRFAIHSLVLLNVPVLVHIPQILRDDLITAFFMLSVASVYRGSIRLELDQGLLKPQSILSRLSWKVYLAIGLMGLYLTRPEFSVLFISFLVLGTAKKKKHLAVYLTLLAIVSNQISTFISLEFGYWLKFFDPASIPNGFRRLLFSPTPNNVFDVFNSGRSHSLAAFWYLFFVPVGAFLSFVLCFGLMFEPSGRKLFQTKEFKMFGIIPIVFVLAMSSLSFGVQGPRQGLAPSLVLGCLLLAGLFGRIKTKKNYKGIK